MSLSQGQSVFLRNGIRHEVVTFVRFAPASRPKRFGAAASPYPSDTAFIKRQNRLFEELVMIDDIEPIHSPVVALIAQASSRKPSRS
jgi:hypothetical protein